MARRRALATTLVIACVLTTRAPVAADVTDDRRALVMLRVLAYDKQLAQRVGDEVRIVVAYTGDEDGLAEGARWTGAFAKATKLTVNGRPVVVVGHRVDSAEGLARVLDRSAAVLACDGVTRTLALGTLAKLTRGHHVLSMSTRESDVAAGLSVAIVSGKQRDEIVVNAGAAQAEGVKFDAGLLQLAREARATP
jgi:hypothetical protein